MSLILQNTIVFAIVLWLFNSYIPVKQPAKNAVNIIAFAALVIWLIISYIGYKF